MEKKRDKFLESVGRQIRARRKDRGWSQERLAHLCAVDRTFIGGIERGERNTSLLTLRKIASAMNCGVADLLPPELKKRGVE